MRFSSGAGTTQGGRKILTETRKFFDSNNYQNGVRVIRPNVLVVMVVLNNIMI